MSAGREGILEPAELLPGSLPDPMLPGVPGQWDAAVVSHQAGLFTGVESTGLGPHFFQCPAPTASFRKCFITQAVYLFLSLLLSHQVWTT